MDQYYYLNSSLPYLAFGQPPLLSRPVFLEAAKEWLSAKDWIILKSAGRDNFTINKGDPLLLKQWKRFEYNLRYELYLWRSGESEGRASRWTTLFKERNPLECEYELMSIRWKFLDELEEGHFFDLEYLIIYSLKLSLLEYWFSFDRQKGISKFEDLISL